MGQKARNSDQIKQRKKNTDLNMHPKKLGTQKVSPLLNYNKLVLKFVKIKKKKLNEEYVSEPNSSANCQIK